MAMQIDKTISLGNIVSWLMIVIAVGVGYGKMTTILEQNGKDVKDAKDVAARVEDNLRTIDSSRSSQIGDLKVSLAETKVTILFMSQKLDEFIKQQREKTATAQNNRE